MTFDKAVAVALELSVHHRIPYRVYSVRSGAVWRWFVCPKAGY